MAVDFRTQLQIFQSMRAFLKEQTSSALTDFNIGSIINSIFYTISNSLGSLYSTAQNIFSAAFVSTATGSDLDKKVADFTLTRKAATRSFGVATFFRTSAANIDYTVPNNTTILTQTTGDMVAIEFRTISTGTIYSQIVDELHVYIDGTTEYDLERRLVSSIVTITGTISGSAGQTFVQNIDYRLNQSVNSQHTVKWLPGGVNPTDGTDFFVTYRPLSIDIDIEAIEYGTVGDVPANTITVVPNAPAGIDGVKNFNATSGGTNVESDTDLRARVPLFLSTLARATKDALLGRTLNVTGVVSATVVEPDFPTGIVNIIIDDGSGTASDTLIRAVKDAIDGTENGIVNDSVEAYRAAGIWVNVTAPNVRTINVELEAYITTGSNEVAIRSNIETNITNYLNTLRAGEDVVRAKIIDVVMNVTGVSDVNLSNLKIDNVLYGNIQISSTEVARLGVLSLLISAYS